MKNIFASFEKKRVIFVSLICGFFLFIIGKKIFEYSTSPSKEKNCDFTFPNTDHTKLSTLALGVDETPIRFAQKTGVINDASCLNKTPVYGVVKVIEEKDIEEALQYARENKLTITPAGERHSMGGQSFQRGGIILDMKNFNKISLDRANKTVQVQSGATWEQIQKILDTEGLSVKAMQSINIFTVGGTLSVNAHGIAHNPGSVAPTVRSIRVMLPTGEIKTASPTENSELFSHVLGGYGLFGVILDAEIDVVKNEMYEWNTKYLNYYDFTDYYKTNIAHNQEVGLTYARLSVAPDSFLKEVAVHTYTKTNFSAPLPPLVPDEHTALSRFVINFSKTGELGRWTRWMLEKYVEPHLHTCTRNQAMSQKEVCLVSRNQEMYDSMGYLKNRLKSTDILQEYFIPQDKMPEFVDGLRSIIQIHKANLLNVTIRIVPKDTVTALPYAKENMFGFVLYINQKFTQEDSQKMQKTTTDLIDLATSLNGTYYLPYQLSYTNDQLKKAYPETDSFFAKKKQYDPNELFTNTFYQKYK